MKQSAGRDEVDEAILISTVRILGSPKKREVAYS
jgi:hypothetical protein